jgi:hypothetical protein
MSFGIIFLFFNINMYLVISEYNHISGCQHTTKNQENHVSKSFTIIALPDTQHYSSSYPEIFSNQTQWIVDNKDKLHIVYVGHEGDIVNKARSITQWQRADTSMSYLEDPISTGLSDGIPYSVVRGNHDIGQNFDKYFGITRFNGRDYYGDHYSDNNQNNYVLFEFEDYQYISISLDYDPDVDELNWAESILQNHSERKAIIISHSILDNPEGDWTKPGINIYNKVKNHTNVFLMLCGHRHYEARRKDLYNGTIIHTVLADFQDYSHGGDGWLRIMEVFPETNKIKVKTYSPYLNQYKTDPDSEFTLRYDNPEPQPPPEIKGPTKGKTSVSFEYNFTAIDPEGDDLYYFIKWGDDTNTGWIGPYSTGEVITLSHNWSNNSKYVLKAKVKDIHENESEWAFLEISMPKTKSFPLFNYFMLRIIQVFKIFHLFH